MSTESYAVLNASTPRRMMGTGVLLALGFLLLYLAAARPPAEFIWTFVLLGVGVGSLVMGYFMWQGTAYTIELSDKGLVQSDGSVIAAMEDIAACDRGMFAFKPSNGFLVRLKEPAPAGWSPGMWWRVGKRLGVGGVTQPAHAKMMADTLSALLAQRDASEGDG